MKILAADLGGDKLLVARVQNGEILGSLEVYPAPVDLMGLEKALRKEKEREAVGLLAIGTAGVIVDHAIVEISPNLRWLDGINLRQWAKETLGLSAWISNDMEAAGKGENEQGNLADVENAILDTISTGWGGVLKVAGRIYPGEPGHRYAGSQYGKIQCGCGRFGCNEAVFSGGAIRGYLLKKFSSRAINGRIDGLDPCAYLDQRAKAGESWALELYQTVGKGIGEVWAGDLNRISCLERIVYMGKFAMFGMPYMIDTVRKTIRDRVMFPHHRKMVEDEIKTGKRVLIYPSAIWPNGGLLGAAAIAQELEMKHRAEDAYLKR